MTLEDQAQQLWIFIGEKDRWAGKPLYLAILEVLQRQGCSGATVFRGLAGFGANSLIHTVLLLELSTDLPIVITLVDRKDRLQRILPEICEMVQEGLVTLAPVEVVKYTHRVPGPFPPGLTAGEIMTRDVVSVGPETAVAEVLVTILDRGLRAVPVLDDDGRVLGTINEEDLLTRAGLELPASIQREVAAVGLGEAGASIARKAKEVMRPGMPSVRPETTVAEAAARMAEEGLKRLAVVDESGRMIGILSRSDVLKTVIDALEKAGTSARPRVNLGGTVAQAMQPGGISVGMDAPLADVLDRIMQSRSRYVVVADAEGRVAGIITEGDILKRAGKRVRPEVMRAVGTWLKGGHVAPGLALAARGKVASEVMSRDVVTVRDTAPVAEALRIMIDRIIKVLPVVDEEGRFVGTLNRSALLAALARRGGKGHGGTEA
jgi:CBS domain-containing protein/PII-like signaling protein